MITWTLIILIAGNAPAVITPGYSTEAACRAALAAVAPSRRPGNEMRPAGEIIETRCFPAAK
jgi:hypothetical protein